MSKMNKIVIGIWVILAILSFGCSFFCPLIPKIIGIAFGIMNLSVIGVYVLSYIKAVKEKEDGMSM